MPKVKFYYKYYFAHRNVEMLVFRETPLNQMCNKTRAHISGFKFCDINFEALVVKSAL